MDDLLTQYASITSTSMSWEDTWIVNRQQRIVANDMILQTIGWKRLGQWDTKRVDLPAVLFQVVIFINLEELEKTQKFFTTSYQLNNLGTFRWENRYVVISKSHSWHPERWTSDAIINISSGSNNKAINNGLGRIWWFRCW